MSLLARGLCPQQLPVSPWLFLSLSPWIWGQSVPQACRSVEPHCSGRGCNLLNSPVPLAALGLHPTCPSLSDNCWAQQGLSGLSQTGGKEWAHQGGGWINECLAHELEVLGVAASEDL